MLEMRNFWIFGGVLLALAVTGVVIWLKFPSEKHPSLVQDALLKARARFAADQANSNDPEVNGYQDPLIRSYVGPGKSSGELAKLIESWNERYSASSLGTEVDHRKLLAQKNPDYLSARKALDKVLPVMNTAFRKPSFVLPIAAPTASAPSLNYVRLRAIAQAASGYLDSVTAEGKPEKGIEFVGSTIILGRHLQSQNVLISDMIGIAIQAIGFDALATNLQPSSALSAQDWQKISSDLKEATPDPKQMRHAIENEIHFATGSIRSLLMQPQSGYQAPGWARIPGALSREIRIYKNRMAEHLRAFDRGLPQSQVPYPGYGLAEVFSGRNSVMADLLIPNIGRADSQMIVNRAQIRGLGVAAAILGYAKQNGKFPADLPSLGFEDVESWEYSRQQGTLRVPIDPSSLKAAGYPRPPDAKLKSSWVEVESAGILFRLKPADGKG